MVHASNLAKEMVMYVGEFGLLDTSIAFSVVVKFYRPP